MSVSPQEKEKLRKKLQKLFKNDCSKGSVDSTSNKQSKNVNKTKDPNTINSSRNMKKQQKYEQKGVKSPKSASTQNGFAKTAEKQRSENKLAKSKQISIEEDAPKLEEQNSKFRKANAKVYSKKQCQYNTKISQKQSNKEKQIKVNQMPKKPTKTKDYGNITKERPESIKVENYQKKKITKPKSDNRQNITNINKNQSKKAKKRVALNSSSNSAAVSNKKQKITKKVGQNDVKINTSQKAIYGESDSSSSQYENEYEVSHMAGYVPGGDFDSDNNENYQEHRYWMQEKNYGEHDSEQDTERNHCRAIKAHSFESNSSSNKTFEANNVMNKFKAIHHNNFSDSEEEDFGSDSELETDDCASDSFGEENENYSDYDEEDYEEEEDSFSYTSESDNECYTDYDESDNDMSYEYYHDNSDHDYELPEHVPEDLIIHKGTSIKRDLKLEDNVSFDSDNEATQVLELENHETVKTIQQPKAYDKEELLKLKFDEKTLSLITLKKKDSIQNDDQGCPKLVPIVDEEGFQLYNPNDDVDDDEELENYEEESMEEYESGNMDHASLGSEYTEIDSDDADSLLSEDINEKYLKRCNDTSDSDDNMDENMYTADVIDATGYECEKTLTNSSEQSEVSLNDDIMQIPSLNLYKNVDLKTESSILSATIMDNKIHFSSDNFERDLNGEEPENISNTQDNELIDDENSTDELPKVIKPCMHSIVNYNTKFVNAFSSNSVIVLLKDPFYIYGTVRLTLLAGSMEVYGHSLKLNTEVEIFSPRGCSVIEISSLPTKNNISKENLTELLKLYEKQFSLNDLKTIVSLHNGETDAVVLLKRNEERKKVVQQYKKFMNENVFPNINNINAERPLYNSEYLLRCMINTSSQEQKCLRLPKDWQQFKLTSNSRVMLAGGKSVGKSTLLRYLINRHLPQKVLLIDLDIGQPEVFIPQTVSCTIIEQPLLGPGFLLNLQPEISFAVGHTNIALCAHKYLSAVRSLIAYCRDQEAYKDIPWLINTMGYNKGFGLELISVLVQQPLTDVIQLQSSKEINNFESTLEAHVLSNVPHILFSEEYERIKEEIKGNWNYRLHVWPSAVQQESRYQKEWEMSAKDLRFAMLLARLSQALQGHADWLTDVKPFSASLDNLKIINLMDNNRLISAQELEKSIEANLVYLCHYQEDKPLKCLGIGVVRGVDFHVRHVYLIPALPYNQLKDVNCLGIGEMPLPTSLFTNQGPRVKNIAPFVYNTVSASASKAIKQIYHRPAKFLKGKHKSIN